MGALLAEILRQRDDMAEFSMRIFFCERCRKRLTDDDVAKGLAVDKKFNGVYCKGCAEGVEVLESWCLPSHQKQAPRKTTPQGGQAVAAPLVVAQVQTHTAHAAHANKKATVYGRSAQHRESSRESTGGYIKAPTGRKQGHALSMKTCLALSGLVLLMGSAMVYGFSGKGSGAEKRKLSQPPAAAIETPADPGRKKPDGAVQAEKNAEQAFERLMLDWKTLTPTAQQKLGERFLADHGNSIIAARVRNMLGALKK